MSKILQTKNIFDNLQKQRNSLTNYIIVHRVLVWNSPESCLSLFTSPNFREQVMAFANHLPPLQLVKPSLNSPKSSLFLNPCFSSPSHHFNSPSVLHNRSSISTLRRITGNQISNLKNNFTSFCLSKCYFFDACKFAIVVVFSNSRFLY